MFGRISPIVFPHNSSYQIIRFYAAGRKFEDVLIIGVARTPLGSFQKSLAPCSAPMLGSVAIKAAVERAKIDPGQVEECFMGLVVSAYTRQAPARQAALKAGLSKSTPCTAINKLCASGMKSIMLAAQSIALGQQNVVCAGGMESMSNVPFYLPRSPPSYGGAKLHDGIIIDGLFDPHYEIHMGQCAEKTAAELKITREAQDQYARLSYERSQAAAKAGIFDAEVTPVAVPNKKAPGGHVQFDADEEYLRVDFDRFAKLKPAFVPADKGGTVTAANASTLNDGAAAAILASGTFASNARGVKPLARIVAYADAAVDPIDFPVAPYHAVEKLLKQVNLSKEDITLWEINEAFSAVALANVQLLGIPVEKVNVHGGAVSIGHPIGMSGTRITIHLALHLKPNQKGIAAICNGGGGASAILLEGV